MIMHALRSESGQLHHKTSTGGARAAASEHAAPTLHVPCTACCCAHACASCHINGCHGTCTLLLASAELHFKHCGLSMQLAAIFADVIYATHQNMLPCLQMLCH